jgi:CHAD domain-containing protein
MTTENLILKNWRQEQLIFLENLTICRNHPVKKSVHDIRVAIKKMRSYLRLKEELAGEKWKEEFSEILILFKSFGRLRDIEMSISLIRKEEKRLNISFTNFKKYLIVNRSLVRKWVKQDAVTFNEQQIDGFAKGFNPSYSTEELIEKIIRISESKIKKAKQLSRHFQKRAHNIRKELKDVFYWLSICPADMAINVINLKSLDKILDQLGKWQDHFILVKKTNRYLKDFVTNDDERKALKEFQSSLLDSQAGLLDKAKKKWKEQ